MLLAIIILSIFIGFLKLNLKYNFNYDEFKVFLKLKYFSIMNHSKFKILSNLLLETENGHFTEIDHIIINKYGLFVLETKGHKANIIIGRKYDNYWSLIYDNNNKRLFNPLKQNVGHIKTIRNLIPNFPIYNTVVFTNVNSIFTDVSNVLKLKDLSCENFKTKTIRLENKEIEEVYSILKNSNKNSLLNKFRHIRYVKKKYKILN